MCLTWLYKRYKITLGKNNDVKNVTKLYLTKLTKTYEHPNSKIKAEVPLVCEEVQVNSTASGGEFRWDFKIKPETFVLGYTVVFHAVQLKSSPPQQIKSLWKVSESPPGGWLQHKPHWPAKEQKQPPHCCFSQHLPHRYWLECLFILTLLLISSCRTVHKMMDRSGVCMFGWM